MNFSLNRFWSVLIALFFAWSICCEQVYGREYEKREVRIEMRDGVTLHTTIYEPKDDTERYPILLNRTPYGCNPYGSELRSPIMYNPHLVDSGYIFVYQDLRSRSMSDGSPRFENLKPVYSLKDLTRTDEATDAFDSIAWLLENVPNHNGRVGCFGSSYTGYTALMAAVSQHPNIKAVLAAGPCVDNFFEDFGNHGLFGLAYVPIVDWFGTEKFSRATGPWWDNNLSYWADGKRFGLAKDSYEFFLRKGALANFGDLIAERNYFWADLCAHPNYDEWRKERNALQYLNGIQASTLIVGGWNDEQNLYGTLKTFKKLQTDNPSCNSHLVMGPWNHSAHKRTGETRVGDIHYGDELVADYQREIEFRFFESELKRNGPGLSFVKRVFDTGSKKWLTEVRRVRKPSRKKVKFWFGGSENLSPQELDAKAREELSFEFVSNPSKPVPYSESDEFSLFPKPSWMTGDQRFASRRPDVLTFSTEPLEEELVVAGPILASLKFSTSQTDADLIVKLIDVYPMEREPKKTDVPGVKMNGYQQLVRCGQIRGRFRENFSTPKPFQSGKIEDVSVDLLDVQHTFKVGHRIMVQVQSSLFPLFDRNPQKYVENVFFARDEDFVSALHRLHGGSYIELEVISRR